MYNPLLCILPVKNLKLDVQPGCEYFVDDGLNLDLNPGETRTVQLFVTPARAGDSLVVVGLKWQVFTLPTIVVHRFERKGKPLNVIFFIFLCATRPSFPHD